MSKLNNPGGSGEWLEYINTDPDSPGNVPWVKRTVVQDGDAGYIRIAGLPMLYVGDGVSAYQLSYLTDDSGIKRVSIT